MKRRLGVTQKTDGKYRKKFTMKNLSGQLSVHGPNVRNHVDMVIVVEAAAVLTGHLGLSVVKEFELKNMSFFII